MAAFVQGNNSLGLPASTSSFSLPFLSPQTDGNLNVILCWWRAAVTVDQVFDTAGNIYVSALASASFGSTVMQVFYCAGIQPALANTVTFVINGSSSFMLMAIAEFSGLGPNVNPIDITGSATGSSVGPASVTLTTSNANDLIIGCAGSDSSNLTGAAGTSYTLATGNVRALMEYLAVSSSGAQAATTTPLSATAAWAQQAIAFKNATSPTQVPVDVITSWVGIHRIGLS